MRIHYGFRVNRALEELPRLERLGIGAEIFLEANAVESYSSDDWHALAAEFAHTPVSFHAPFWNLDLLSPDASIARLTARRYEQTLHAVHHFSESRAAPVHVVIHSGIPHGRTIAEAMARAELLIPKLAEFVESAAEVNAIFCLENSHEPDPSSLKRILEGVPGLGSCFDAAHAQVFSRSPDPQGWLALQPTHLHLNDNRGEFDEHLPLGTGILPHLSWLPEWAERAPLVLEVRGDPSSSVDWLRRMLEGSELSDRKLEDLVSA
jgi:sugar phosphate isomerase/epimerase